MDFYAKTFEELSTRELYEILRTRAKVFIEEENFIEAGIPHVKMKKDICQLNL